MSTTAPDTTAIEATVAGFPEVVKETKEGYKTTEFWVAVVTSVLTVVGTIPVPEKFQGVVVAALGIAYALSRGLAKKGIPAEVPVLLPALPVVDSDSE